MFLLAHIYYVYLFTVVCNLSIFVDISDYFNIFSIPFSSISQLVTIADQDEVNIIYILSQSKSSRGK